MLIIFEDEVLQPRLPERFLHCFGAGQQPQGPAAWCPRQGLQSDAPESHHYRHSVLAGPLLWWKTCAQRHATTSHDSKSKGVRSEVLFE